MAERGVDYTEPKVGDIVTSRWSSHGAHWEVTRVDQLPPVWGRKLRDYQLTMQSLKTKRFDTRSNHDLRKVDEL